ncbi:hypothetical protein ON05_031795 (plasmid) [Acaryochloris sp. CCMEE 5410]|nr:hypothetical protein ON05_031795 [Acaryochloris sp. CCMEE 5410]
MGKAVLNFPLARGKPYPPSWNANPCAITNPYCRGYSLRSQNLFLQIHIPIKEPIYEKIHSPFLPCPSTTQGPFQAATMRFLWTVVQNTGA